MLNGSSKTTDTEIHHMANSSDPEFVAVAHRYPTRNTIPWITFNFPSSGTGIVSTSNQVVHLGEVCTLLYHQLMLVTNNSARLKRKLVLAGLHARA